MDFLVVAPAKMDDSRMANHDPLRTVGGAGGNDRLKKSGEGCAFEPNHRLPDLFGAFAGYGGTRQGVPAGVAPVSMRMCNVKLRAQRCWE